MKLLAHAAVCALFFAAPLVRDAAAAELVMDGTFVNVLNTPGNNYTFGLFGTYAGSTLTEKYWATSGYNFVFAPNTADSGTGTNGANAGQPNEAPGAYNTTAGYGSTYLFGAGNLAAGGTNPGNGGLLAIPTDPAGGNFIGADGAFGTKAITQTITGLTVGNFYAVSFYWAGAQQQGASYTSDTKESWTVGLANLDGTNAVTQSTATVNPANKSFSGWIQQAFVYKATATSEVLSFLAAGSPTGQPPFALLGGVSMVQVPEPTTCTYFYVLGAMGLCFEIVRRRRQKSCADSSGEAF